MPLASTFLRIEPAPQSVDVVSECSDLGSFALQSFPFAFLSKQRVVLARVAFRPGLVRVKPPTQGIDVVAERSNLSSFAFPRFAL